MTDDAETAHDPDAPSDPAPGGGMPERDAPTAVNGGVVSASDSGEPCPVCAAAGLDAAASAAAPPPPSYVYAIGRIEPRFPALSVEKEFAQVVGRMKTDGLTDVQLFHRVLSLPENRYLARLLCWVLSVREIETYILRPNDPADFALLVDAIRPEPSPLDLDIVIGVRGPIAPPNICNGLTVPIVLFDQIYSFDRPSLVSAIPRPKSMTDARFTAASDQVLDTILQIADNAGGTDEQRALNYLSVRYPDIYRRTAEQFDADFSLSGVDVRHSSLGGVRNVVDCVFSYTSRNTGFTEKSAVAVDVTDEFPFLVSGLSAYYDRTVTY